MKNKRSLNQFISPAVLCLVLFSLCLTPFTESAALAKTIAKTIVKDEKQKKKLLGRHMLSLQWISWKKFGVATVSEKNGTLYIKGQQLGKGKTPDYVKIDGVITEVHPKKFKFDGTVLTRVSHINNGEECRREGEMTFEIRKKRKYWRLAEMKNPCSVVTDYVDIYF